jgi:16S rRNA C967 or C1407 C5-methylase (RsmB/RsmF family)
MTDEIIKRLHDPSVIQKRKENMANYFLLNKLVKKKVAAQEKAEFYKGQVISIQNEINSILGKIGAYSTVKVYVTEKKSPREKQIVDLLQVNGPMKVVDIAANLGTKTQNIYQCLYRKTGSTFTRCENNKWGMLQ